MNQYVYRIEGRVQGVGFRHFAMTKARRLNLSGWVKNLPDGAVECLVAGPEDQLMKFESALRQGPSLARVTRLLRREDRSPVEPGFDVTF